MTHLRKQNVEHMPLSGHKQRTGERKPIVARTEEGGKPRTARQQKFVKDNRSHLSAVRAERIVTAGQYQEHDAAEASQSRQESIAQHHGNAW